jgi:5-methyltetrahydrofolate--homocysteine methyltransferase
MDMQQKRERHLRFWQPLEKGEGGYLAVSSPAEGKPPAEVRPPKDLEEQWLCPEYRVLQAEASAKNTFYGQDAIQNVFVNLGPGVHAALLGAPYVLRPDSVWFDMAPPIKSWDTMPVFKTDREHRLYKVIEGITRAACEASEGRWTVSFTDLGGQYDILFSLRGEDLLADLIEYPDEVIQAEAQLDDEFLRYFFELRDIIGPTGCGYSNWMPLVSDVPWYPIQCDLSVMISPKMFEKFVLPSLDKVSAAIGRSIYHLDGPEEIQHLDMILAMKHVNAIQWVPLPQPPSASRPYPLQRFDDAMSLDVYRRCLAAGKKVVLLGVSPAQVEPVINAAGSDGVFIYTGCPDKKSAEELISHAHKQKWIR